MEALALENLGCWEEPPAEFVSSAMRCALLEYNDDLDSRSSLLALNERRLETLLERIGELPAEAPEEPYWLTMARIMELALLCAGAYADNGEFRAAGDLLANPRRVMVHLRGEPRAIEKERRRALTACFSHVAERRRDIVQWLKENATIEIRKAPLLPHLFGVLRDSGAFSERHLDSVRARMERIAEAMGVLAACGAEGAEGVARWLSDASPGDREYLLSRLCRFDTGIFRELGREIRGFFPGSGFRSAFLRS